MTNPFYEYIENVEANPQYYSAEIKAQIRLQKEMLQKYDFVEEEGRKAVDWIEKYCYLTEGENAGGQGKSAYQDGI